VGLLLTDVTGALVKRISASGIDGSAIHTPTSSGVTLLRNHLFANASGTGGIGLANSLISHNIVEDNTFYGFFYFELNGTTLEHNVIRDNGTFGISLGEASSGNRIAHNRITRSGIDGIALFEDAGPNLLVGNRSDGNADDGFDIAPAGSTLVRNSAMRNGDLGFEAPLGALVATHNRARHNGNPQQCLGIPCR
jgi:parallel beta-helix repeat protein